MNGSVYLETLPISRLRKAAPIASRKLGDPIPNEEKRERRSRLLATRQTVSWKKNRSRIGQIQKILVFDRRSVRRDRTLLLQGRNRYQAPEVDSTALINEGQANVGKFHRIEITEAPPYDLIGRVVQ